MKKRCLLVFGSSSHVMRGYCPTQDYDLLVNAGRSKTFCSDALDKVDSIVVEYDLSKPFIFDETLRSLLEEFQNLDVIYASFEPTSLTKVSGGLTENLLRPLQVFESLSRHFPSMTINAVFISSMYGYVAPKPDNYKEDSMVNPLYYGVSKAGVDQGLRWLSVQNPKHTFNSIALGPMPKADVFINSPVMISNLRKSLPSRMFVAHTDLHLTINYLLSLSISSLRGAVIHLDGGYTIW